MAASLAYLCCAYINIKGQVHILTHASWVLRGKGWNSEVVEGHRPRIQSFIISLDIWEYKFFSFVLFYSKSFWVYLVAFPNKFWNQPVSYHQMTCGEFVWDYTESIDEFRQNSYFLHTEF